VSSDGTAGLDGVRRSYERGSLDLGDLSEAERADPLAALRRWLDEAVDDGRDPEPTAMVLATVTTGPDGVGLGSDARVVLCKGVDDGVTFFSNRGSAKGRQLAAHARAAVVFHWAALERQVRVRGVVSPVADAESDAYFATRPRESRIGAWASSQSAPIGSRAALEQQAAAAAARHADGNVPRPERWGGYRLVPDELELWQGRPGRLHDRLLATRADDGWDWVRLQP
jgi:pyridoxamine 5'-phosphate oxidase